MAMHSPRDSLLGPMRLEALNAYDGKLTDGRNWRAGCMVGGKMAVEAASVTAEPVRCSAW